MYKFYDKILNEIDLQDLAEYLAEPLNHLSLLIDKLEQMIQSQKNGITATELLIESKKIVDKILPELIDNYCNLSLNFRNNVIIKQYLNKDGIEKKLTSKDLLLKNTSKIIEHIQLLEEKFYKEYSFDFLVNSRIISELGFQSSFIEEDKESIELENKYKFNINDSQKIINEELIKNGKENFLNKITEKKENKVQSNVSLLLKKEEEIPAILEKKNKEETINDVLIAPKIIPDELNQDESSYHSINLTEMMLVVGFMLLILMGVFIMFDKVKKEQGDNLPRVEKVYNQSQELIKMEENTKKFKEQLKIENEINNEKNKQELIKMNENTKNFKENLNNENLNKEMIENYLKENSNKNTGNPYSIIEKNFNSYSTNEEELKMKERTLEFIKNLQEQNKKAQ